MLQSRSTAIAAIAALSLAACDTILGIRDPSAVVDAAAAEDVDAAEDVVCAGDPCENPDPEHCAATCIDEGGQAVCSLAAADRDRDGHADRGCTHVDVAGDDCDDGNEAVRPGADERCDGLDNDCDGLYDLEDGQLLTGQPETFASANQNGRIRVAWAPGAGRYGVAWAESDTIFFNVLDESGARRLASNVEILEGTLVGMAAGADTFALLVASGTSASIHVVSAAGDVLGSRVVASEEPFTIDVARLANGTWAVIHDFVDNNTGGPRRRGTVVSADGRDRVGDALTDLPASTFILRPRATGRDNEVAVAWMAYAAGTTAPHELYFARYSSSMTPIGEPRRLEAELERPEGARWDAPVVAATPRGYAVAWGDGKSSAQIHDGYFVELDPDGAVRCGPRAQTVNNLNVSLHAHAIVPLPGGDVAIGWQLFQTRSGTLHLTVVRDGCRGDEYTSFESGGNAPQDLQLVAGARSVMAAWRTFVTELGQELRIRPMGPRLCDALSSP